jgi:predicted transcriptional regulator
MHRSLVDIPKNVSKSIGLEFCECEDFECEFCICPIFEFMFGMKATHIKIYFFALKKKRTIKEIAKRIGKDRTTTLRILQNIIDKGLMEREVEMLPHGGVRHIFSSTPQKILKERIGSISKELTSIVDKIIHQDWTLVKDKKD